jgi:hypothetical protein
MMKRKALTLGLLMVGTLILITGEAVSQEGQPQMSAEEAAMMAKWQEMSTPGSNHKKLHHFVGEWSAVSKSWMQGPNQPPTETKGEMKARLLLDGRFLREEFKGTMMGMPFEGVSITGYDNFRRQYRNLWMDTFGTGFNLATGNVDASGKVFKYYARMDNVASGEVDRSYIYVIRIINENKHIMEVHDASFPEGQTKQMEITYTRK